MRRISFLIGFLMLLGSSLVAQLTDDLIHSLRVDLIYLASDYTEGRLTGTEGEARAADYLVRRFREMGLQPAGDNSTFLQAFPYVMKENPHAEEGREITGHNVIAYLDNGAPYTAVIGAHYDHLGLGGPGSLDAGQEAIHNGADDNASGVASMLYIADFLAQENFTNHNYLFIAFSGEELGLIGSKAFTKDPTIDLEKVSYMINMDMLGRLPDDKKLVVNGVGTSPSWKPALEKIDLHGIQVAATESGVGPSDHTSFYLKDIPAVHFFSGLHQQYHKPSDDANLINYQGLFEATEFILALIEQLDKVDKMEFTPTQNDQPQRQAADFKVTLGVMPDYSYQGEGMRIDAAVEGRPAEKAGLEGGDVIIKIGDLDVKDIYDYMEGLSKFQKGDKAKVRVKRKEEELEYEVEF